jgi:hypothetical protein
VYDLGVPVDVTQRGAERWGWPTRMPSLLQQADQLVIPAGAGMRVNLIQMYGASRVLAGPHGALLDMADHIYC